MKSVIIDLTKTWISYNDGGFNGCGFGNIIYIIGYTCSLLKNKNTPVYVKVDKNINEKTYNDAVNAIKYFDFNNFNIKLLTDQNLFKQGVLLSDVKQLNDNSQNIYIINKRINNTIHFFDANTMVFCKKLSIGFKNPILIKNVFYSFFPQINENEEYIAINVRRGEKLNMSNYLIVPADTYHEIIKNNQNKKIIFVSDDIPWCKENFSQYENVIFSTYNEKNKIIIDQFILFNSSEIVLNMDCTFSHIPFLLKDNKVKKLQILVKQQTFNNELNINSSRFNIIKNNIIKNCKLIGILK